MAAAWEADFVAFYRARGAALQRTAYLLCGNRSSAEDLLQAAFVKLYRVWPRLRDETAEAYARQVLVRTYLAERRLRRSHEVPTSTVPDRAGPDPDNASRLDVQRALAALPVKQRAVIVLRYWLDLSVTETATLLGISEGTVKSHTARALTALRGLADHRTLER